jgi:hypothetical protein
MPARLRSRPAEPPVLPAGGKHARPALQSARFPETRVTKIIMVFFAAVAAIQLIKPLGWPGLHHRRDAWKLAAGGFLVTVFAVILAAMFQPAA